MLILTLDDAVKVARRLIRDDMDDAEIIRQELMQKCWFPPKVDEAPTIEQEIIVCADCKHWICHDRRCGYWNHGVKPLDWCSYAERRTDG